MSGIFSLVIYKNSAFGNGCREAFVKYGRMAYLLGKKASKLFLNFEIHHASLVVTSSAALFHSVGMALRRP